MSEDKTRIEKDSMGEFEVPANAMYGASTAARSPAPPAPMTKTSYSWSIILYALIKFYI